MLINGFVMVSDRYVNALKLILLIMELKTSGIHETNWFDNLMDDIMDYLYGNISMDL